jgi:cytochrome b6-f complex iron-sulfur subunit
MAKKLSTAEILARARGESGGNAGGEKAAADAAAPGSSPEPSAAAPEASPLEAPTGETPAKPAGAPQSTKDKLAAARADAAAKKAGGAAPAAKPAGNGEKPAAAGKPVAAMTTAEKLAAMRAEAKSGGKKPTGTEVVPKATAKAAASPAPAGERLSVQEMIKVAREGGGRPAVPAKREIRKPAAAAAARKAAAQGEPDPQRRNAVMAFLLSPFVLAWVAFTMASTAFVLGMARFMMPNVLVEPPSKFKIGPPVNFPPDTVNTSFTAEYGVWIVNTLFNGKRMIYALSTVCTHLGCTPNWLDGEQKFKCPCHGSGFYMTGINFEGPAPRPLERAGLRIAEDGMLEVDKSVKFQEEMGQWNDPTSFVQA